MHILMICASAPGRERPRTYGFLATLAGGGHAVTLIFVDRAGTTFDDLAEVCRRIVPVRGADLAAAIQVELDATPFDLVHLDGLAARLLERPLPLPTVVDVAACGFLRRERAARVGGLLFRAARAGQVLRARGCQQAVAALDARLLVATPDDAWALRALGPAPAGLHVVPTLVDLERFAPPAALRDQTTVLLDLRGLDWGEAVAALAQAQATLARVWAQRSDVRLTVLGRVPLGGVGRLAGDGRVSFTGATSDPRGYLAQASLVLAPGVPAAAPAHTPLEAMATGAPVVGTPALAHDLGAAPGHDLVVAATPDGWSAAILALLDDAPYRGQLGRAGRRLVALRHGRRAVAAALEDVYAVAVGVPLAEWRLAVGLGEARREAE